MAKFLVVLCVLGSLSVYFFPEHDISLLNITVTRFLWKVIIQIFIVFVTYNVFIGFPARKAKHPDYIYFTSRQTMRAHLVRHYGVENMELSDHARPKAVNPTDVLVRVHAASINPIDLRIMKGYARPALDKFRLQKQLPFGGNELPVVLGRDCSGVVEAVGSAVGKFRIGDEVWLSVGVADTPGTFAELVLAKEFMIAKKPRSLDHTMAASIPYVCTTTWSALVIQAGLGPDRTAGKRVLIPAGTGGIGTFAIQLVKAWGGHVTTTCTTDGVALMKRLGADDVIDYTKEDFAEALSKRRKFDVAYITLGQAFYKPCLDALKTGGRGVTIVPPLFFNLQKYGRALGTLKNIYFILSMKIQDFLHGRTFSFVFNMPNGAALEHVANLVDDNKIQAVVQKTFDFNEANEALEFVKRGHARGKTVIVMPDN